jgi:predicted phosphodiesterase
MVIALLSDVHGNAVALEAVLRDLEALGPDRVVCLGDVAGWGPQPSECVRLLAEAGCAVVMGNSDAWMLSPEPFSEPTEEQRRNEEIEWWCRSQLGPEDLATLGAYEPTVDLELGEDALLLCCHGSPRSYNDPMHSDTPGGVLDAMLAGVGADAVAAGHTHVPMVRRHGELLLVNPGSVGIPYVRLPEGGAINPVWAEYALLSHCEGRLDVSLRRVPFDLEDLRVKTFTSDMPHAEAWLADRR